MAGGPPWATRGTKGSGETVATSHRPTIVSVDKGQSGSVASGAKEQVDVFAPSGSVYYLIGMKLEAQEDGDASSGTHGFKAHPAGSSMGTLWGKSAVLNH